MGVEAIGRVLWSVGPLLALTVPLSALELGAPADCTLGETCFVQQLPDLDRGPGAIEAFCGARTYDGHTGTDVRVRSLAEAMRNPTAVVAMAPGTVLHRRDGMPDSIIRTDADIAALDRRDCGNGVVIDHGNGWTAQYCHLQRGSVAVGPGDTVDKGERLGDIGASGFAAFAHVHVTLRKDEEVIDPLTGGPLGAECGSQDGSMWDEAMAQAVAVNGLILDLGVAGEPPEHARLAEDGGPLPANVGDPNTVGWAWFINLAAGDEVHVTLTGPDGEVFADSTLDPLPRNQASYSAYVGRSRPIIAGDWTVRAAVLRGGEVAFERQITVAVD